MFAKFKKNSKFNKSQNEQTDRKADPVMIVLIMTLLAFGLIMLFSASFALAYYYRGGNSLYFINRQAIRALIGLIGMILISRINYHSIKKFTVPIFIISLILLIIVLFMKKGESSKPERWINIGPVQFQPSELMKFALIALFASIITKNHKKMETFVYGILPFALILGIVAVLMLLQPHLSGTILMCLITGVMVFVGGAKPKWFVLLFILLSLAVVAVFLKGNYMGDRVYYWLHPFADTKNKSMQTAQSLLTIGSGGFFGLGLGQSRQKFMYLPETQNDFIFAIICEELGVIGAAAVILLFFLFCYKGFEIASKAKDLYGSMLCTGIIAQFGLQALINIAVVTSTVPNTGIPLPFFSYGGTALVMQLFEIGVVLNISRFSSIAKINLD